MGKLGFRAFVFYTFKEESEMFGVSDVFVDELYLPHIDRSELWKGDIINISLRVEESIQGTKIPKDLKRKCWELTVDQKQYDHEENWNIIRTMSTRIVETMDKLERTIFSSSNLPGVINRVVVEGICVNRSLCKPKPDLVNVFPPVTLTTKRKKCWDETQDWMRNNLKNIVCVVGISDKEKAEEIHYDKYEPVIV